MRLTNWTREFDLGHRVVRVEWRPLDDGQARDGLTGVLSVGSTLSKADCDALEVLFNPGRADDDGLEPIATETLLSGFPRWRAFADSAARRVKWALFFDKPPRNNR